MAIDFNANALQRFTELSQENKDLAVNVNKETSSLSTTRNGLSVFRGKASKIANNEARTELLKSLGSAFGLSGMEEKNGKVTFSREFMQKLQKLIGPAFKMSDFGVPAAGGAVSSGKPLTARRVSEIMDKVKVFAGSNKEFNAAEYEQKLANAKKEMGFDKLEAIKDGKALKKAEDKLSRPQKDVFEKFQFYSKCLDFIKNIDTIFRPTPEFDAELLLRDDSQADEEIDIPEKFQFLDPETGAYKTVRSSAEVSEMVMKRCGGLLHLENCSFDFGEATNLKDFEKMKNYIRDHLIMLTKGAVDNYYNAQIHGKMDEYVKHFRAPGACVEAQVTKFIEFNQKHFPAREEHMDKAEAAELVRIAKTGEDVPLHECIFAELESLAANEKYADFESWEEYAPIVKEHLLGTRHPVTEVVDDNGKAKLGGDNKPVVNEVTENGKPVVRPLTAEDIDRNGKLLYNAVFAF
ncbi:MAG: hypothetical protein IJ523_04045 [Succinivibrionaceae bacterium]|nr:hypothetical protein [Succinivibrionaceae bacterium]